jgi:hypothetical protein
MSEFKGSKGPWLISDGSEKWNRIVDVNGDLITTCFAMQNEDDANARLIAAAPELLEALQDAEKALFAALDNAFGEELANGNRELIQARAAIAKALGQ